jgi:hypothetical protein
VKRATPELDCLMWTLVEENNPRAVEEFLQRFPDLKLELERRGKMVNGLKNLKPESKLSLAPPPPFRPRSSPAPMVPRGVMIAVAALSLAALGVASFTISYFAAPPRPPEKVGPVVQTSTPTVKLDEAPKEPRQASGSGKPIEPHVTDSSSVWMKPIHIKIDGAPLSAVVQAIGAQAGQQVILAPGMKSDPSIALEYNDRTAIDILTDLGKQYGFTPFDQGDGSIIIVPATEGVDNGTEPTATRGVKDLRRSGG